MIRREIAKGGMPPSGVVGSEIMTDFQARFALLTEAATVEQFSFRSTPKRFGMGVVVAVAAAAPATTTPRDGLVRP